MTINVSLPSFKNWKTTAVGLISAALGFFQAYKIHDWHQIVTDPQTMMLFIVALLGIVSKDWNTTGGSVGQPSTPEALHESNAAPSITNPPKPPDPTVPKIG